MEEFFNHIMKYPRSPITDAIPQFIGICGRFDVATCLSLTSVFVFSFIDTRNEAFINFGEFVDVRASMISISMSCIRSFDCC